MLGAMEREFRRSVAFRQAKRIVILLVGGTVLIVGIALLVLPGPAFLVIPAGLSILAIEFAWARRLLRRARSIWENSRARS
jgi:tellurite resistance protein TerC